MLSWNGPSGLVRLDMSEVTPLLSLPELIRNGSLQPLFETKRKERWSLRSSRTWSWYMGALSPLSWLRKQQRKQILYSVWGFSPQCRLSRTYMLCSSLFPILKLLVANFTARVFKTLRTLIMLPQRRPLRKGWALIHQTARVSGFTRPAQGSWHSRIFVLRRSGSCVKRNTMIGTGLANWSPFPMMPHTESWIRSFWVQAKTLLTELRRPLFALQLSMAQGEVRGTPEASRSTI